MHEQIEGSGEVFISYSWDNEAHVRAVLELSNRLRHDGVDCVLDQYEESPAEGWPRWMDRKIRTAQFVLMVCTDVYKRRVEGEEVAGKGLGVRWEGNLIYQHIYSAETLNKKFIPVLMRTQDVAFIPVAVAGSSHYSVEDEFGYKRLYSRLVGQGGAEKPPLGSRRPLPEKEPKTKFNLFVASPIDLELWDKARWIATFFLLRPDAPPSIGLAFRDRAAATCIFEKLRQRYGERDEFEELRLSIVEGEVAGESPGYTVHFGVDPNNTKRRCQELGLEYPQNEDMILFVGRINRMNPPRDSTNLKSFKTEVRRFKAYSIIPGTCRPDGSDLHFSPELFIYKNEIAFRTTDDIGENDLDSIVLGTGKITRPENRSS